MYGRRKAFLNIIFQTVVIIFLIVVLLFLFISLNVVIRRVAKPHSRWWYTMYISVERVQCAHLSLKNVCCNNIIRVVLFDWILRLFCTNFIQYKQSDCSFNFLDFAFFPHILFACGRVYRVGGKRDKTQWGIRLVSFPSKITSLSEQQ